MPSANVARSRRRRGANARRAINQRAIGTVQRRAYSKDGTKL